MDERNRSDSPPLGETVETWSTPSGQAAPLGRRPSEELLPGWPALPDPRSLAGDDRRQLWPQEPARPPRRGLPVLLFLLTCASTFFVGGPAFAVSLMTILLAHELGHYLQARKNGVPASLPYFLPMPISPIGTMGAVIAMRPRTAGIRALFDVAVTGPVAGLVPSLVLSYVGLTRSVLTVVEEVEAANYLHLGEPLVFKLLSYLVFGPVPPGMSVTLDPIAFAGWVGIFITALNMLPIGQLDGGHILYALSPRVAYLVSLTLLGVGVLNTLLSGNWTWTLMLLILILIGVRHPPTAGGERLDLKRKVLGTVMLAFVIVGFTPTPFIL